MHLYQHPSQHPSQPLSNTPSPSDPFFIRFYGAEVLTDILLRSDCQLTHLNLTGNALGDKSLELLSSSLSRTHTLMHLELRSNAFTGRGLAAVGSALVKGKVGHRNNHGLISSFSYHSHSLLQNDVWLAVLW